MGRFFVTTPIYYVNDAPHIGHAYTTVTGDALCRWHRLLGDDVFYLTGTDEHGLKMLRAAEAKGLTPKELADENSARFRDAWDQLGIAYDQFIRTTEPRHYTSVQRFLQTIYDNGDIELRTYEGLYCVACEAYYTEDEAGVDRMCPIHGRPLEWLQEENYFFLLSRYEQKLLDWFAAEPRAVVPEGRRNEVLGFIRGGLQDISVSRTSFDWGVPLPWDPTHVAWVWFDALPNYITAAGYGDDADAFAKWWPVDFHLVGKDIIRFHCVWWPAMCMAAGIDPPRPPGARARLAARRRARRCPRPSSTRSRRPTSWPTSASTASATTSCATALRPRRRLLLRGHGRALQQRPRQQPRQSSCRAWPRWSRRNAAASARQPRRQPAGLGGRRCLRRRRGRVGPHGADEALEATWRLIRETNAHLEANEPWKAEPGAAVDAVMGDALEALRIVAVLASPAMPGLCRGVAAHRPRWVGPTSACRPPTWGGYPGGVGVATGDPLFPRK